MYGKKSLRKVLKIPVRYIFKLLAFIGLSGIFLRYLPKVTSVISLEDGSDPTKSKFIPKIFSLLARYYSGPDIIRNRTFRGKTHFTLALRINEFTQNGYYFDYPRNGLIELIMSNRTAGTFVDVGANIGVFSMLASQYFERVFAFEPYTKVRDYFLENISDNKINNINVIPIALASKPAVGKFRPNPLNDGGGQVEIDHAEENPGDIEVTSLDCMDIPDVKLVKIDVEGGEINVLLGALQTISRFKPAIFAEVSFSRKKVERILEILGDDYLAMVAPHENQNSVPFDVLFVTKDCGLSIGNFRPLALL